MSYISKYVQIANTVYEKSRYLEFIHEMGFTEEFVATKMSSPKRFCKERKGTLFKAWQVAKRMEGR